MPEPIAKVAEISKLWVVAQVKERDINSIKLTESVHILTNGQQNSPIIGKIFHISEVLDEATRSVQVIVECDNNARDIKPGMYVSIKFTDKKTNVISVPAKSVFQSGNNSYVFVKIANNKYQKRNVKCSGTDGNSIIIESGLNVNETIVSEGGYYLTGVK